MIRPADIPHPLRATAAMAGIAGVLALAGCASADTASTADTGDTGSSTGSAGSSGTGSGGGGGIYADGTYTAQGSYATPESVETITVTVTLEDAVITSVDVVGDPSQRESEEYQGRFIGGIADVVVGQDIDEISVSRVAGSSLTSGGFNQAMEEIKAEAAG